MSEPSIGPESNERQLSVLLVAPNVSSRRGGEAIKALHIWRALSEKGVRVEQLTHSRVRADIQADCPDGIVHYLDDDWLMLLFFRLRLTWLFTLYEAWRFDHLAKKIVAKRGLNLIHFTAPISPTRPYFINNSTPVVIGPLNGNLPHPPAFAYREGRVKRIGNAILRPYQLISKLIFRGKAHSHVLAAGGSRTRNALVWSGCRPSHMHETLDSGIDRSFLDREPVPQSGVNAEFIFVGRLVRYKGCDLAIKALAAAPTSILHVVGDGEERASLIDLAKSMNVTERVIFHGWMSHGDILIERMQKCRGFVFPTLAEANGIVIQEAMALGLPIIAVDWGGPADLLDDQTAILVRPDDEQSVIRQLADGMRALSENPDLANRLGTAARQSAIDRGFIWPELIEQWLKIYQLAREEADLNPL